MTMYFVSIDATEEPMSGPKFGRLVNHGSAEEVNSKVVVMTANSLPVLCIKATKKINRGDEILYDYGISEDKMPWLRKVGHTYSFLGCKQ